MKISLRDWVAKTGIEATHPTTEKHAVSVVIDQTHPHRAELWQLSDYHVSSALGVVIWLMPKKTLWEQIKTLKPLSNITINYITGLSHEVLFLGWCDYNDEDTEGRESEYRFIQFAHKVDSEYEKGYLADSERMDCIESIG